MKIGINDLLNIKEDKETFINFLSNPFSLILGINDNDKETINKRRCIDCTRTQTMEGVALLESGIVSEELEEAVTKIGGSAAMKVVRQAIWMSKQHKYRHILPQLLRLARRCVFAIG
ncbi:MAG: hypothetical protein EZS28_015121 [Streblomastix strix]|uniref:Uncharacterized protein n=1 Tax=Streblomastix strix TaxID=222440 RepID=A0A5J4W351_9EUKA|nr:MAG: hypothetical protein EZS28_015121 [Streblomastix strix]